MGRTVAYTVSAVLSTAGWTAAVAESTVLHVPLDLDVSAGTAKGLDGQTRPLC
jgi:hypothetical protein